MSDAAATALSERSVNCWFAGLTTLDVIHRSTVRPGPVAWRYEDGEEAVRVGSIRVQYVGSRSWLEFLRCA